MRRRAEVGQPRRQRGRRRSIGRPQRWQQHAPQTSRAVRPASAPACAPRATHRLSPPLALTLAPRPPPARPPACPLTSGARPRPAPRCASPRPRPPPRTGWTAPRLGTQSWPGAAGGCMGELAVRRVGGAHERADGAASADTRPARARRAPGGRADAQTRRRGRRHGARTAVLLRRRPAPPPRTRPPQPPAGLGRCTRQRRQARPRLQVLEPADL